MMKIIGLFVLALILALAGIRFYQRNQTPQETTANGEISSHPWSIFGLGKKASIKNSSLSPMQALAQCVVRASALYRIPTDVMIGIMYVEGGRAGQAVGPNVNGTYDLGIMQVNSLWIPQLAKLWQVDYGTAYNAVRDSGCENIYVGAWILRQSIEQAGSLSGGIGYYHSATQGLGSTYADKVMLTMQQKGLTY